MLRKFRTSSLFLAMIGAAAMAGAAGVHGNAAVGQAGQAAQVTRTVEVEMTDNMRYTPASINVKQGETVLLRVKNAGLVRHELVIGTPQDLVKHYDMMKKMPGMEHADANMVSVAAGQSGEIVWRFTQAGMVDFACLQPGHYDAGMQGLVNVAAAQPGKSGAASKTLFR